MKRGYSLRHHILPVLGFAVGTLFVLPACAQTEQILNYHSDIEVRDDGTMVVTKTILVESPRDKMRHGIYRDFPTQFSDHLGSAYQVGFELLGATRDGGPEETRLEDPSNGKRIYLGSSSYALPSGRHRYTQSLTPRTANWDSLLTTTNCSGTSRALVGDYRLTMLLRQSSFPKQSQPISCASAALLEYKDRWPRTSRAQLTRTAASSSRLSTLSGPARG